MGDDASADLEIPDVEEENKVEHGGQEDDDGDDDNDGDWEEQAADEGSANDVHLPGPYQPKPPARPQVPPPPTAAVDMEKLSKAIKSAAELTKFVDKAAGRLDATLSDNALKCMHTTWAELESKYRSTLPLTGRVVLSQPMVRAAVFRTWLNKGGIHKALTTAWTNLQEKWNALLEWTEEDLTRMKVEIASAVHMPQASIAATMSTFFSEGALPNDSGKFWSSLDEWKRRAHALVSRITEGPEFPPAMIPLFEGALYCYLSRNAAVWSIIDEKVPRLGMTGERVPFNPASNFENLQAAYGALLNADRYNAFLKHEKRRQGGESKDDSAKTDPPSKKPRPPPNGKQSREEDDGEDDNSGRNKGGGYSGGRGGRSGGRGGRGGRGGGRGGSQGGRWCSYHNSHSHNTNECRDVPPETRDTPKADSRPPAAADASPRGSGPPPGAKPAAPRGKFRPATFGPKN